VSYLGPYEKRLSDFSKLNDAGSPDALIDFAKNNLVLAEDKISAFYQTAIVLI
jgi:hypothetical protein